MPEHGLPPTPGSPAAAPAPADRWIGRLVAAAAAFSVACFLIVEIHDYDIWWHLAIGRAIIDARAVPRVDHFTLAGLGQPYHDSHWLFQVVFALVERVGGIAGVSLGAAVLWGLALVLAYVTARRWTGVAGASLLAFLAAMASSERFLPRPEVVTCLMIALFSLLLQRGGARTTKGALAIVAAQVVWTNSHGLFVLGPLLVGASLLDGEVRRDPRRHLLLLALTLLSTLAAPWGWNGWRYALVLFSEVGSSASAVMQGVGELSPTLGAAVRSDPAFRFFAVLAVLGVAAVVRGARRRQLSPPRLLVAAALFALALTARRNMALFAMVAPALCAEGLGGGAPWLAPRARRCLSVLAAVCLAGWGWYPISGRYYTDLAIHARFGLGASPSFYPHALLTELDRRGFRGNVYSSNKLGGYYLYRSWPGRIPLDDGRWEVYPPAVIALLDEVRANPARLEDLAARYRLEALLIEHEEAPVFVPYLLRDGRWRLVAYDGAASFWGRPDDARFAPGADLSDDGPLPPAARVEDVALLERFLAQAGSPGLRLRNLERAAAQGALLQATGLLQLALGRHADAERTLRARLREDPRDDAAISSLAFIAAQRGDLREAHRLMRQAVELRPDESTYRTVLARIERGLEATGK